MENYIVRIYRRDAADPHKVAGVFESVEQETENTFTNLNSLVSLLASNGAGGDTADVIDTARAAEREILTD
jgi:hypothetical protein